MRSRLKLPSAMHWVFAACGLVLLLGCGGPPLLDAGGTVRFDDGQPVQTGVVEFRSTEGKWRASSNIARDGSFSLSAIPDGGGIPAGTYEVIVAQQIMTDILDASKHDHGRSVAARFNDYYTSGLRVDVTPESAATLVVELPLE